MNIEFTVNKPQLWLKNLAGFLNVEINNNAIFLPNNIGEGYIRQFHFEEEFTLNYLHCKLLDSVNFIRKAGDERIVSPVMFYINSQIYEQQIDEKYLKVGLKTSNGIFWPSNQIESKWFVPKNEWITNITVTFFHNWLSEFLDNEKDNYLTQLLNQSNPFYIIEDINSQMIPIIKAIESEIQHDKSGIGLSNLYLKSKTIELLLLFFEKLSKRVPQKPLRRIHPDDIEKIFEIKNLILENHSEPLTVKQLKKSGGMSETKLQNLFKHVFGKSLYQYAIETRMNQSRQLLESGKYSVAEVGHEMGYSNLSHFSAMFYKYFGDYPKNFLPL